MEPSSPPFTRIAIMGLGLMGASLGMALRSGGFDGTIAGYDAQVEVARRARERGAMDEPCVTPAAAVAGADLVVLATPISVIPAVMAGMAPHLAPDAIVTDLASVKQQIIQWAERGIPSPERFVGGHPMAGSESGGVESARADLYAGCAWCLTPVAHTSPMALRRVSQLTSMLGASPMVLDPAAHDEAVALVSHLPRLVAVALALTASRSAIWSRAAPLAAGGFRDTTRVASGDSGMLRDICATNRAALLATVDAYLETLRTLRADIVAGAPTLPETFAEAKYARDDWLTTRDHL
ncbi:MAG TPA: prephenate dehydrogenase/arogenate dehydrogenase family protein [Ktedonobacterales bacterium]